MCHYTFYIKKLSTELSGKAQETAAENGCDLRLKKMDSYYGMEYKLTGEKNECDESIAQIMSDMLQKQAIVKVCDRFLKEKEGLSSIEQREIGEAFLNNNFLSRQEGFSYVTYYLVYLPILHEIREKQGFNIDGWLSFRMNKYLILLRDLLEQFVADYFSKKEVVSFIRLMREASLLAVPLEELMHIVYSKEGKAMLYNERHKNVTAYYIKKYCKDLLLDSTLTREDFLLHVLITISPKKIVIHHKERMKNKQLTNILEIIFEENMTYCPGCEFCETIE